MGLGKESDIALGIEPEPGFATGLAPPGAPSAPPEAPAPAPSAYAQAQQAMPQPATVDRDIQLLNAKLGNLAQIKQ